MIKNLKKERNRLKTISWIIIPIIMIFVYIYLLKPIFVDLLRLKSWIAIVITIFITLAGIGQWLHQTDYTLFYEKSVDKEVEQESKKK